MTPSRRTGRRFPTLTFVFVALLAGGSVLWSYWTTLAEAAERWAETGFWTAPGPAPQVGPLDRVA